MISKQLKTIHLKDILDDEIYNTNVDIQRDYIYGDGKLSSDVIDSIMNDINIATITIWDKKNNTYDIIDGKQRTISIRRFFNNRFAYNGVEYQNFTDKEKDKFLHTEIVTCIQCGNFEEKVKCFTQINNGMELKEFEKIYAMFHGKYLKGMKGFSNNEFLVKIFGNYSRGKNCMSMLDLLTNSGTKQLNDFLRENQNKSFNADMSKLLVLFMKSVEIFDKYGNDLDVLTLILRKHWKERDEWIENSKKICDMLDKHYVNKDRKIAKLNGISLYVFYSELLQVWNKTDLDPHRFFTQEQKYEIWQKKQFASGTPTDRDISEYAVDHKTAWARGGKTVVSNGQLILPHDNSIKGTN